MKIIVLGANGRTGKLVVEAALARHMEVTAVVRSPDKHPGIRHEHLKVVVGDPCDPAFLTRILPGHDVLVSALGGRLPTKNATSVYVRSAEAIVAAARATDLQRVLVTSTALLFREQTLMGRILCALVPNVVRSAAQMERVLQASGLAWTSARAGFLNDADDDSYIAANGEPVRGGTAVSRHALAKFLIDAVGEKNAHGACFGIANSAA